MKDWICSETAPYTCIDVVGRWDGVKKTSSFSTNKGESGRNPSTHLFSMFNRG